MTQCWRKHGLSKGMGKGGKHLGYNVAARRMYTSMASDNTITVIQLTVTIMVVLRRT